MKYIKEYLKDVIKVEPLGELTTMDDKLYGMSGEMVYIDGKCSDIFISHADYVNWLEKQDEQNPADKVEPKFKVGDWVVYDHRTYQIVELPQGRLINASLSRNGKTEKVPLPYCEKWSIQDAKDGDVLVLETDEVEWVFIYKEIVTSSSEVPHDLLKYHFLLANNCCSWQGVCAMVTEGYEEYLKPATKEQRGLLFQKMKESGFKWENNQLEKSK